jgi:hypothetical protein
MGGLFRIVILILILPLFFCLVNSENVSAVGPPVVILRFLQGEETQFVDVRPGENPAVVFPGTVEVELKAGSAVQDVVVDLFGNSSQGWQVNIKPEQVHVSPGDTAVFQVHVKVPSETSMYLADVITISGLASPYPGSGSYEVSPITGTININQFFKFNLECNKPHVKTKLDKKVSTNININNYGNGIDRYSVRIANLNELERDDIIATLSISRFEVDEKSSGTVFVYVETADDRNCIGKHKVEVEVYSLLEEKEKGTAFVKTYVLEVEVENDGALPGFESPLIICAAILVLIIAKINSKLLINNKKKVNQ